MYCTWQCQREHWENVHKHQCKYISKLRIKNSSVYAKETCPDCKLEAVTGQVEMCRPENPLLGCPLDRIDFWFGLPLALGEMTGQFSTKAEATFSLMLCILLKMKEINHTAWVIEPQSSEEMWDLLVEALVDFWSVAYMFANPGPLLDEAVACASNPIFEVEKLMKNIDKLLIANRFKEDKEVQTLGYSEMSGNILKIRVTADQHSDTWQTVLNWDIQKCLAIF